MCAWPPFTTLVWFRVCLALCATIVCINCKIQFKNHRYKHKRTQQECTDHTTKQKLTSPNNQAMQTNYLMLYKLSNFPTDFASFTVVSRY